MQTPNRRSIDPFAPASLGPKLIRNRFVKAATFEGMAVDNLVSDRLIDFHRAVAAGGVGMTTRIRRSPTMAGARPPRSSSDRKPAPAWRGWRRRCTPKVLQCLRNWVMRGRWRPARVRRGSRRRASSVRWR